jgi:ubiquitin C-terminal hydrolase
MILETIANSFKSFKNFTKDAFLPASDVDESLKRSVASSSYLDKRIDFVKAKRPDKQPHFPGSQLSDKNAASVERKKEGDPLKKSESKLFPVSWLSNRNNVYWSKAEPIGPGFQNMGNTCFLNSVLQCLTYTPPLAIYCKSQRHAKECRKNGFCLFCAMERHVNECNSKKGKGAICPREVVGNLKNIAKHMRVGAQEDAHEFLRFVVDGLQKSCLFGKDPQVKIFDDCRIQL